MPRPPLVLVLFALGACSSPSPSAAPAAAPPTPGPSLAASATAPPDEPAAEPEPAASPADVPPRSLGHCKAEAPATPGPALKLDGATSSGAVDASGDPGESAKPVFSGSLFQQGSVARGAHDKLIVPDDAVLVQGTGKSIEVLAQKALGFRGHPPEPMPLAGLRQNLGVATRSEGKTLELATFGEFATKEGGASIRLVVQVPAGVAVVRHAEYSGVNSTAMDWKDSKRSPTAGRVGYWYATPNPGPGWQRLALKDDPRRAAAQGGGTPARLGCQ